MPRPAPSQRPPAPGGDDDATVVLRLPPPRRARWPWLVGAAAVIVVAGLLVAVLRPAPVPPTPAPPGPVAAVVPPPTPSPPAPPLPTPPAAPSSAPAPVPAPAPAPPPPAAVAPAPAAPPPVLRSADEAGILADAPEQVALFRFAPDPAIVVLDFPSLESQGRALNRVAALVEKAGLPRDRVLSDTELDAAIRAHGDTVATFYYGHDYPAAALARFFALADRDHVALGAPEEAIRDLLRGLGWLAPGASGALISLSREGADADITPPVRAAILHHELSHGAFFAEPAFADYVRTFWRTALTAPERAAVTKFLGAEDYDTADADLMANEMQAYLMFTDDPRFFLPSNIGMTDSRRADLRAAFRRDLPLPWLRAAVQALPVAAPVVAAPVAAAPVAAGAAQARRSVTSSARPQPAAAPR